MRSIAARGGCFLEPKHVVVVSEYREGPAQGTQDPQERPGNLRGDETSPPAPQGSSPPSRVSTHSSTSAASCCAQSAARHQDRRRRRPLIFEDPLSTPRTAHLHHLRSGDNEDDEVEAERPPPPSPCMRARVCTVPQRCGYPARALSLIHI